MYSTIGKSVPDMMRKEIKEGLSMLKDDCVRRFERMYPCGIDKIPDEKLDWALSQVERTLQKPDCLKNDEQPKGESGEPTDDRLRRIVDGGYSWPTEYAELAAELLAAREEIVKLQAYADYSRGGECLGRERLKSAALTADLTALKTERDGLAAFKREAQEVARKAIDWLDNPPVEISNALQHLAGEAPQ